MKNQLVNFEHFNIINEANQKLDAYLDSVVGYSVNEAEAQPKTKIGAALGSPVKFIKIKNNAKKYQQALVQKALNNVDYEKKKQAAGGEVDKNKVEVLKAANAAKNQALTDKATAISDRMTQLATSPGLQKVKTLAVSKAKVAAAETALKGADAEETKQLKVKIKELNAKAADAEQAIKDYEKDEPQKQDETPQQEEPKAEEPKAEEPKKEEPKKEEPKAKSDENDKEDEGGGDPVASLEKDIADFDKNIKTEMATVAKLKKDLDQAKRDASTGRGSDAEILKIQKSLDDSNEDLAELKRRKADAKKKIDSLQKESVTYIGESVSSKFRQLMTERLK